MDHTIDETFVKLVTEIFRFLTEDWEYTGPQVIVDQQIHFIFVSYIGTNWAIECNLDKREEWVECKIARVIDGQKTTEYEFDQHGIRVRDSLPTFLWRRGAPRSILRKITGLPLPEAMRITIEDYASMLSTHGRDILDGSLRSLD